MIKNVPDKGVVVISGNNLNIRLICMVTLLPFPGDIFESEDDLRNPDLWRCSSWNTEIQEGSRKRILKLANFIIPGHGIMFKNLEQN